MTNTEMVNQASESIVNGPKGRRIDVMQAMAHVGLMTRMRVGYVVTSLMHAEDYIKFQVSLDRKPRRWVIVKLNADDTYSVEFGRLVKKFYYRIEALAEGVYADSLGETVERLFVEVYS